MKLKTWGTRGSIPVSGLEYAAYGGNTTCVQVISDCLPSDTVLAVDAGTGIYQMGRNLDWSRVKNVYLLFTHGHHDHNQGITMFAGTHIPSVKMRVYGPVEHSKGPRDMVAGIMKSPWFPVPFEKVATRFHFTQCKVPGISVLAIHPEGGLKEFPLDAYDRAKNSNQQLAFEGGRRFRLSECLMVFMHQTDHPERTIAYRFEEGSTARTLVFMTDEEVRAQIPATLATFVRGADLLIQDAQYTAEEYATKTGGYGHGTPLD